MLPLFLRKEPFLKILIIKPSSLGDIIHSLPFLHAVRNRFPNAEIHWVVAKGLHPLLLNHPLIDRLWIMDKDRWKRPGNILRSLKEIILFGRDLAAQRFDVSIDLSGLLRSGLITWASGAKVKLGFIESDEFSPLFYTHKIQGGKEIHAIDRYLKIAAFMGCDTNIIEYPLPRFTPAPLPPSLPPKYIVIAPSAGKEANRWPAQRFGRLAARLPLPSVVISSPADERIAQEVVRASQGRAISLAGRTTLEELFALIRPARFFITNDTGPMHIAVALSVPIFAIFGPANPIRTGPYGKMHTVIREDLPCSPCYRQKPCSHWRCMEDLTVEKVLSRILPKL